MRLSWASLKCHRLLRVPRCRPLWVLEISKTKIPPFRIGSMYWNPSLESGHSLSFSIFARYFWFVILFRLCSFRQFISPFFWGLSSYLFFVITPFSTFLTHYRGHTWEIPVSIFCLNYPGGFEANSNNSTTSNNLQIADIDRNKDLAFAIFSPFTTVPQQRIIHRDLTS